MATENAPTPTPCLTVVRIKVTAKGSNGKLLYANERLWAFRSASIAIRYVESLNAYRQHLIDSKSAILWYYEVMEEYNVEDKTSMDFI